MYEAFFKFHDRPFLAAPQAGRYFPATAIENARQTLRRCIDRGEGAAIVIGPSGTGKTLLCQRLAEEFSDRFGIAMLAGGRLGTPRALLQAILYELGAAYRGLDDGELRLAVLDYLEARPGGNEGLLLLIDEADTLPWRVLDEVRQLTNVVRNGQQRVRVVLAGSPRLEERFASPKMNSFSQRLAARCYLESLDSADTSAYVQAQIAAVGGEASQVFDDEALRSIYRATDGVPRLINQVCDHALILANLGGMRRLTTEAIEEAWSDLQQLPAPWSMSQRDASASPVVEFGGLDSFRDDAPEAIPFRAASPPPLHVADEQTQIDMIAEHLARIDAPFEPAGSIGTEADLAFPELGDPFHEEFAEEEVVFDRFSLDHEIFIDAPRVASREGRQLGALLPNAEAPQPRMEPPEFATIEFGVARVEDLPADAWPLVSVDLADPTVPIETAPAIAADVPTAPVKIQSLADVRQSSDQGADLIVIEEPMLAAPAATRPKPAAPKREYRQLFAKLRRG